MIPAGFMTVSYTHLAGDGADAYLKDSDGTVKSGGMYFSRAFYLDAGGFDMSWDCGLCTCLLYTSCAQ